MAPEMVEEFVAAYSEEVNRQRREATAARAGKERALAEVRRKLDKLIEALIGPGLPGQGRAAARGAGRSRAARRGARHPARAARARGDPPRR